MWAGRAEQPRGAFLKCQFRGGPPWRPRPSAPSPVWYPPRARHHGVPYRRPDNTERPLLPRSGGPGGGRRQEVEGFTRKSRTDRGARGQGTEGGGLGDLPAPRVNRRKQSGPGRAWEVMGEGREEGLRSDGGGKGGGPGK